MSPRGIAQQISGLVAKLHRQPAEPKPLYALRTVSEPYAFVVWKRSDGVLRPLTFISEGSARNFRDALEQGADWFDVAPMTGGETLGTWGLIPVDRRLRCLPDSLDLGIRNVPQTEVQHA